jgi:hypothetical protein
MSEFGREFYAEAFLRENSGVAALTGSRTPSTAKSGGRLQKRRGRGCMPVVPPHDDGIHLDDPACQACVTLTLMAYERGTDILKFPHKRVAPHIALDLPFKVFCNSGADRLC